MALVEAARFADSFEAGMARARLEAEGILSILFGLDSSPAFAGGMFNIRLMVDEDELDAAQAILNGPDAEAAD
jgi:hypothetical protein